MTDNSSKKLITMHGKQTKSARYVIVEALCPKFFTKYLDILVRCAEFGDASKTETAKRRRTKNNGGTESVESVMEDVRNVDWSNLDVATTVRMVSLGRELSKNFNFSVGPILEKRVSLSSKRDYFGY